MNKENIGWRFANISHNKNALLKEHVSAYTVPLAVLSFKNQYATSY